MNLNSVLDELLLSVRAAMTKFETVASTLVTSHKQQLQDEEDHRALTAALRRGAGSELDDEIALQLAFDTVLADLIKQSLKKTRRAHAFYLQHVMRVEEDCQLQLAEMRETLRSMHIQIESLRAQNTALQFKQQVSKVQRLREGSQEMQARIDGGQPDAGNISDIVGLCLQVDENSSSMHARLARQVAEQLVAEREESLRVITQLTEVIETQEKMIKR